MTPILERLCRGENLDRRETASVFGRVVRGEMDPLILGALLVALRVKGETPEEIAGAATALRESALAVDTGPFPVADTCGTGGDGAGTVNISTAAALAAAAAGVFVAKHGNRSVTSGCGSADVLESCGVRVDAGPANAARCLREVGICFLFAPLYHPGMRHAMPVRRALAVRTIFNVLGPLCNPARPCFQVVGVYDPALCRPLAETLGLLGLQAALVVHGDGLDEIALHGETRAALWRDQRVEEFRLTPEGAGLPRHPPAALRGGTPTENAGWLRRVLAGRGDPAHTHAVAINAGALLWICGCARSHREGAARILEVLAGGAAGKRLEHWAEVSRSA